MARIKTLRVLVSRMDADARQIGEETVADIRRFVPRHRDLYKREIGPGPKHVRERVRAEVRRRARNVAHDVIDDVSSTLLGSTGGTISFGYVAGRIEDDANDFVDQHM